MPEVKLTLSRPKGRLIHRPDFDSPTQRKLLPSSGRARYPHRAASALSAPPCHPFYRTRFRSGWLQPSSIPIPTSKAIRKRMSGDAHPYPRRTSPLYWEHPARALFTPSKSRDGRSPEPLFPLRENAFHSHHPPHKHLLLGVSEIPFTTPYYQSYPLATPRKHDPIRVLPFRGRHLQIRCGSLKPSAHQPTPFKSGRRFNFGTLREFPVTVHQGWKGYGNLTRKTQHQSASRWGEVKLRL